MASCKKAQDIAVAGTGLFGARRAGFDLLMSAVVDTARLSARADYEYCFRDVIHGIVSHCCVFQVSIFSLFLFRLINR